MTSAMYKLRELLDEYNIEWRKYTKHSKNGFTNTNTVWFVPFVRIGVDQPGGFFAQAGKSAHGLLHLKSIVASPEHAIIATIGDKCEGENNMIIKICDICNKTVSVQDGEQFYEQCVAGNGQHDMCQECYDRVSEAVKEGAQRCIDEIKLENEPVILEAGSVNDD